MKKMARGVCLVGALAFGAVALGGCSYAGVTSVGGKVVVTRNDGLLMGVLRKIYVCEVADDGGLTNCVEGEAP